MSVFKQREHNSIIEMKTNEPFLDYLRVIDLGAIRAADISDADLGASRRYPDCEMTRQQYR